jgi:hypothetical protein
MKLADHINIIWPERKFVAYGDQFVFEDGGSLPTQAQLNATRAQALAAWDAQQKVLKAPPPVTRRQLKRWLLAQNLLPQVPQLIAAITDENARAEAQIDWEDASVFEVTNPLVINFATALGLSNDQLNEAWVEAALIS